jgi:hypothetical protein
MSLELDLKPSPSLFANDKKDGDGNLIIHTVFSFQNFQYFCTDFHLPPLYQAMKKLLPFTFLTILLSLSSYSGFGQCQQAQINRFGEIKKDTLLRCGWTGLGTDYYQNYTYQWFYEDNLIGTTSYINTNKDGWYKLSVINGSCQSRDSVYVVQLNVDIGPYHQTYCGFEKEIIINNYCHPTKIKNRTKT